MFKQVLIITFLSVLSTITPSSGHTFESSPNIPKISLSAQATIHKPADELQMSIGVTNLGENAETVLSINNTKMLAVIAGLEALGLTKGEYQTGRFTIHPTYTPYPKNPPDNWKPSINGYEVNNSIIIKTDKLDMAGKLIDAAYKAGANSIENIHFNLHEPRQFWNEAISMATTNAINDAKVIASAAGVNLGRLLSINLDNSNTIVPRANNVYFAKIASSDVPPIEAGDVTITANVTIIYEISP